MGSLVFSAQIPKLIFGNAARNQSIASPEFGYIARFFILVGNEQLVAKYFRIKFRQSLGAQQHRIGTNQRDFTTADIDLRSQAPTIDNTY